MPCVVAFSPYPWRVLDTPDLTENSFFGLGSFLSSLSFSASVPDSMVVFWPWQSDWSEPPYQTLWVIFYGTSLVLLHMLFVLLHMVWPWNQLFTSTNPTWPVDKLWHCKAFKRLLNYGMFRSWESVFSKIGGPLLDGKDLEIFQGNRWLRLKPPMPWKAAFVKRFFGCGHICFHTYKISTLHGV